MERGYHMHLTGDYVSSGSEFSASKWMLTTDLYLDMIEKDLTSNNWTSIFQALHHLQDSDARDDHIQVGAPLTPQRRQALLPADPLTLPSLD